MSPYLFLLFISFCNRFVGLTKSLWTRGVSNLWCAWCWVRQWFGWRIGFGWWRHSCFFQECPYLEWSKKIHNSSTSNLDHRSIYYVILIQSSLVFRFEWILLHILFSKIQSSLIFAFRRFQKNIVYVF